MLITALARLRGAVQELAAADALTQDQTSVEETRLDLITHTRHAKRWGEAREINDAEPRLGSPSPQNRSTAALETSSGFNARTRLINH